MRRLHASLVIALVAIALIVAPAAAEAAIRGRIVEGVGIKTARLGLHDSTCASRIGGTYHRHKDTSYAGQTVWRYDFARKMSNGRYPVQMYSHGNRHVFCFVVNCTTLVTRNGTHVGTSESTLVRRYGSKLKKSKGPVYTDYHMGPRSGRTDFYVRNGKVHHIVISRY